MMRKRSGYVKVRLKIPKGKYTSMVKYIENFTVENGLTKASFLLNKKIRTL